MAAERQLWRCLSALAKADSVVHPKNGLRGRAN